MDITSVKDIGLINWLPVNSPDDYKKIPTPQ